MNSRVYVVNHVDEDGFVWPHVFLSNHAASEFRRKNAEADPEGDYFIQQVLVNDADTDKFLALQRKLSRVQNRLGKARKALKEANKKLKAFEVDKADGTVRMRDDYFEYVQGDD